MKQVSKKKKNKAVSHKKIVAIECEDKDKLLSFINVMETVATDMGIRVDDGDAYYRFGSDY